MTNSIIWIEIDLVWASVERNPRMAEPRRASLVLPTQNLVCDVRDGVDSGKTPIHHV
jgi:hypothetical protein